MALVAKIVRVDAPSRAIVGDTIVVDVSVKNISGADRYITVTGALGSDALSQPSASVLVSAGETAIMRMSYTMPSKDAQITVWSWYWDGGEWQTKGKGDDCAHKETRTSEDNQKPTETGDWVQWDETLRKMARPDIYRINAFRILGLPVSASPREVSSHVRDLDLMEKYGGIEHHEGGFLAPEAARDRDARREAQQRLLDPQLRFIDEFFWFWPLSLDSTRENDETMAAISQRDLSCALSVWEHHETHGSEANVSVHNLAVLHHAMALDIEFREGVPKGIPQQHTEQRRSCWQHAFSRWKRLLSEDSFWTRVRERIRELDDPRLTTETADRIREGLPRALLSINAVLAVEAAETNRRTDMGFHVEMMRQSGFDSAIAEEAMQRALVPIRDRLKAMCLHCAEQLSNAPESGNSLASDLIRDTARLLRSVDSLLADGDSTRESLHDEVASQVRSCLISFGNQTGHWRAVYETAKKSLSIAESPTLKQRIKEDLETISLNVDYATCWFCGRDQADSDSSVIVMMHGDVQREPGILQTQVRWQYLPVTVPRCTACRSAHGTSKSWRIGGTILGFVLAIIVGIATSSFWVALVVLGAIIAAAHGLAAGTFPKGVKPESYKGKFRVVEEMLAKGWNLGQRPSNVS